MEGVDKDGDSYVLAGSQGGAPKDPVWVLNLRANPQIELRDETVVRPMQVREVKDMAEREFVDPSRRGLPAIRGIPGTHSPPNSRLRR